MSSLTRLMAALSVALLPGFALGHDYKVGDLHVEHPYSRVTAATAMTGAGYVTIMNTGSTDDTLIGVEADFPRVMLHNSTVVDGISSMLPQSGITIPAGGSVSLAPGGLHIMFMGLENGPLAEGDEIPATLVFKNAGRLEVIFNVEPMKDDMESHDAGH